MSKPDPKPAELMPKWWRIASTTVLYAAYLLWLVPFVLYFQGTLSTGSKIEALRQADNAAYARQGDPE